MSQSGPEICMLCSTAGGADGGMPQSLMWQKGHLVTATRLRVAESRQGTALLVWDGCCKIPNVPALRTVEVEKKPTGMVLQ